MQDRGLVERICDDADIADAVENPPQTTRARLRGEFIRRAKERKRDYTVDWVHLKLNDQAQRTVLCKDPFRAHDERVEKLIASPRSAPVTEPMAKLERLLNLTAALLETTRPLSADELRLRVPGYPEAKTSFRRAFERDKEDLREMGIPLHLEPIERDGPPGRGLPDPQGRVLPARPRPHRRRAGRAAPCRLDGPVGGQQGSEALWKLGARSAADADAPPRPRFRWIPHLATLFEAIRQRRQVRFTYRGQARAVDPARLGYERGRWYLTGHDHSRDGTRMFRLDRIEDRGRAGRARLGRPAGRGPSLHRSPMGAGLGRTDDGRTSHVDADHVPFAEDRWAARSARCR